MSDSFAFLSPAAVRPRTAHRPLLRTPVERSHIAAGATIEEAGGWRIARYDAEPGDAWLADVSHTGKLDVRGDAARDRRADRRRRPGRRQPPRRRLDAAHLARPTPS